MSLPIGNSQDEVMAMIEAEVSQEGVMVLMQRQPSSAGVVRNWVVTVGMLRFGLPEIIIFAVDPEVITKVVSFLIAEVSSGTVPAHLGVLPEEYFSPQVYADLVKGPLVDHYGLVIKDYYELKGWGAPKVAQWVVADYEGRFPWNENFDPELRDHQVLLFEGLTA
jgi:hypothetical protein